MMVSGRLYRPELFLLLYGRITIPDIGRHFVAPVG